MTINQPPDRPSPQPGDAVHFGASSAPPWQTIATKAFFVAFGTVTIIYGLILTVILPWSVYSAVSQGWMGKGLGSLIAVFGAAFMTRWCVTQSLAFFEHYRIRFGARDVDIPAAPFVSICVPAYNESETIRAAITSLVSLNYPSYEVIVVDDGSRDDTFEHARDMAGDYGHCRVSVYRKPNGGKSSALNYAYKLSSGALILCVDADSRLERNSLGLLVRRLRDPSVGAVCGQVSIRNRTNLLTRFQALEYLMGNGGLRTALSAFGLVTVVPGPIGLYRREVLEEVASLAATSVANTKASVQRGPLSHATFAEDFQLSLSALSLGWRVVYEPRAKAMTKCPDRIDTLLSQRYRWMRGTWQVFHLYLRSLRKMSSHRRKPVNYTVYALYPADIYLAPILNFLFWAFVCLASISGYSLLIILSWIGAVAVLNSMAALIYTIFQEDDASLLALVPFLDLYQSLLVNGAWVIAAVDEFRGARMRW